MLLFVLGSKVAVLDSFTVQICCMVNFLCRWSWCDWLYQQPVWHWWPQQCAVNLQWQWSGHEHQPPHPVRDGDYLGESFIGLVCWKCWIDSFNSVGLSLSSSSFKFCASRSCCLWEQGSLWHVRSKNIFSGSCCLRDQDDGTFHSGSARTLLTAVKTLSWHLLLLP
jgi:hypothetical protein